MPNDSWMYDSEQGCLECGALKFRESALAGVCVSCFNGSHSEYKEIHDIAIDIEARSFGGDDDERDTAFSEWF